MRFAKRVALIATLLLAVAMGAVVWVALGQNWKGVLEARQGDMAGFDLLLRSSIQRTATTSLAEAEIVAHQPVLMELVANSDRAAVQGRLAGVFNYLKTQMGVTVFQIQTAELKTLIRLHNPGQFDDDVSNSRPMVVFANRSKRAQSGIEIGPTGIAIRGVAPAFRQGTLVGTVEVGSALQPILQNAKDNTGVDAGVVLSSGMGGPRRAEDRAFGDLILRESTDEGLLARLLDTGLVSLSREPKQLGIELGGESYAVTVQPMLDFSGRMIGGLIGAKNVSGEQRQFQRQVYALVFVALCGLIVTYGTIMVTFRALITDPLAAMAKYAEKLDDPEAKPPELGGESSVNRLLRPILEALKKRAPEKPEKPAEGDKA
jgi:hypothetical protein